MKYVLPSYIGITISQYTDHYQPTSIMERRRKIEQTVENNLRMALDDGKRLLDAGKGVWNEPGTLSLVSRIMGTLLTPLMQETYELRKQELQDEKDLASDLSVESLNHLYQLQGMGGAASISSGTRLGPR